MPSRWLTLVGAVGVGLVAEVPTVIVPVAGPVLGDAPSAVALELGAGAGVTAAGLVAVIPTVVVWGGGGEGEGERVGRSGQRDPLFCDPGSAHPAPRSHPQPTPPHPTTPRRKRPTEKSQKQNCIDRSMHHGPRGGGGQGGLQEDPAPESQKAEGGDRNLSRLGGGLGRERFLWSGRGRQASVGPGWLARPESGRRPWPWVLTPGSSPVAEVREF